MTKSQSLTARQRFGNLFKKYGNDPAGFARECFHKSDNFRLQKYQEEILELMTATGRDQMTRIAIAGANGIGKTTLGALISLWGLLCNGKCTTMALSTTSTNVRQNYFGEMKRLRFHLNININDIINFTTEGAYNQIVGQDNNSLWLTSFRPKADNDGGHSIAGTHNDTIICIIDEACKAPDTVYEHTQSWGTKGRRFYLAIGNPLVRTTRFYSLFSADSSWHSRNVSCVDIPYVEQDFIDNAKADYGENSDYYRIHILGQFPLHSETSLIDQNDFMSCVGITPSPRGKAIMGVDIAGEAHKGDKHAIVIRQGPAVVHLARFYGTHDELIKRIFDLCRQYGVQCIYLDALGLHNLQRVIYETRPDDLIHLVVDGVKGNERAFVHKKYANRNTETAMHARNWFLTVQGISICESPLAHDLAEELGATEFFFDAQRRDVFVLGPKNVVKSLLGRSPDLRDAFKNTFANPFENDCAFEYSHIIQGAPNKHENSALFNNTEGVINYGDLCRGVRHSSRRSRHSDWFSYNRK